ncbi:MAG TPA: hypothetical protein VNA15_05280 [Candidatus Angelobacter sp.]|nr:hypothetical protein [Candidatus Angelobacter sp.]
MKGLEAHFPNLNGINDRFLKYDREMFELEGLGFVCPRCGYSRFVKLPQVDEETGMVALD